MSTPAAWLNTIADVCMTEPVPPDPYLKMPGFAFASAMNSGTLFAGILRLMPITTGATPSSAIGVKSLSGS